jgi:peptidoglycan hydrolase-like protein with peptidoglycan-binding domain
MSVQRTQKSSVPPKTSMPVAVKNETVSLKSTAPGFSPNNAFVSTSRTPVNKAALAAVAPPSGNPTLRVGSSGAAVTQLQQFLNTRGAGLKADGDFGAQTQSALKDFQRSTGLVPDGVYGPVTAAKAKGVTPTNAPPTLDARIAAFKNNYTPAPALSEIQSGAKQLKLGDEGAAVSTVQNGLGIPADGRFGPATARAVDAFQKANALKPTAGDEGNVGKTTLATILRSGGSGEVRYGKGWGGSEGVADAAKSIASARGIPVTSEKRNLADTQRVGSSTASDHYTGNVESFATDFGTSGAEGDRLASDIAKKYGIPQSRIGTFESTTITVQDRQYRVQLLWKVAGHFDHVHIGIRRV